MPAQYPSTGFPPGSEVSILRRICNNTAMLAEAAGSGTIPVWVTVPASSSAAGTAGQIAYDGSYLYVCYQSNRWARTPISDWS